MIDKIVKFPLKFLFRAPYNGSWSGYEGWIALSDVTPVAEQPSYNLAVTTKTAKIYSRSCRFVGCLPEDELMTISLGTYLQGTEYIDGWWTIQGSNLTTGYIVDTQVASLHFKVSDLDLRMSIVETAKQLLGQYYLWGKKMKDNLFGVL